LLGTSALLRYFPAMSLVVILDVLLLLIGAAVVTVTVMLWDHFKERGTPEQEAHDRDQEDMAEQRREVQSGDRD
jgi:hypothetical protein